MDISNVFGGDSLKAEDLQGREHTLTIAKVALKEFDKGNKLLINFVGAKKGLIANKTNSKRIAKLYGTNTDNWIGQKVTLYVDFVDFQGETVEAIRIRPPMGVAQGQALEVGEAISAPNPKSPNITTATRKVGGISDTQLPDDSVPF